MDISRFTHNVMPMDPFIVTEDRALEYHRAIVGLLADHPNLITRAQGQLPRMREKGPDLPDLWQLWDDLLSGPIEAMAAPLLADDPQGGLLRAHSPLAAILSQSERKAVWQRVGLQQFYALYNKAVADLDLPLATQSLMTGIGEENLRLWQDAAPQVMSHGDLNNLKKIVSLQTSLSLICTEQEDRRNWLSSPSDTLAGRPMDLLTEGRVDDVLDALGGAATLARTPDNTPVF